MVYTNNTILDYFNIIQMNIFKNQIFIIFDVLRRSITRGGAYLRDLTPRQRNSEEMSQRWRAVGDTAALISPGIEPQASRTDSVHLTTEIIGRLKEYKTIFYTRINAKARTMYQIIYLLTKIFKLTSKIDFAVKFCRRIFKLYFHVGRIERGGLRRGWNGSGTSGSRGRSD